MDADLAYGKKARQQLHENALNKSWRQHSNSYTATKNTSRNPFKLDEQDMRETAREVRVNS